MNVGKLTQDEAKRLIEMTTYSLITELNFPTSGETKEFDVIGESQGDIFSINIFRSKIKSTKYSMGARIKKNGIMLLELHINPSNVHANPGPTREKIFGSHWHIYTEEYGRAFAFPAEDINDDAFVENTVSFLIRFNVVEQPKINYQCELI